MAKTETKQTQNAATPKDQKQQKTQESKPLNDKTSTRQSSVTVLNAVLLNVLVTSTMLYGIVYYWPSIQPHLPSPISQTQNIDTGRISELVENANSELRKDFITRLNAMNQRIESVQMSTHEPETGNNNELAAELMALQDEIAALKLEIQKQVADATSDSVDPLEQELTLVKQLVSQQVKLSNTHKPFDFRLFVAFQRLQTAALSGATFVKPLKDFEALNAQESLKPTIQKLSTYAAKGRPSSYQIVQQFKKLFDSYKKVPSVETPTLTDKITTNLSSFITIRRLDTEGNSEEATLARVEEAVEHENWTIALKEFNTLPDDMQQHWKLWKETVIAYQQIPLLLNDAENELSKSLLNEAEEIPLNAS